MFTYLVGREVSHPQNANKIACDNRGEAKNIDEDGKRWWQDNTNSENDAGDDNDISNKDNSYMINNVTLS